MVGVHPRVEHRDDLLAVAELEQVLRRAQLLLRQLVHRRPVRPPAVGEEEQARERRRVDHLRDRVTLAGVGDERLACAFRHRAHVAARGHRDDVRLVLDERHDVDRPRVVGHDPRPARGLVLVADRHELLADDGHQRVALAQDPVQLLDRRLELLAFLVELLAAELREAAERHVEDVVRLDLGEVERLGHRARRAPRRGPSTRGSP